jgi:hypothetical protein
VELFEPVPCLSRHVGTTTKSDAMRSPYTHSTTRCHSSSSLVMWLQFALIVINTVENQSRRNIWQAMP